MFGVAQQIFWRLASPREAAVQEVNRALTTVKRKNALPPLRAFRGIPLARFVKTGEDRRPEASPNSA